MASVYKALDTRSGAVVAIKRVRTEGAELDERAIRREIDIYTRLQEIPNDHLLAVKTIFRDPGSYALVTEFAEGGSSVRRHVCMGARRRFFVDWKDGERRRECLVASMERAPPAVHRRAA